jgi:hypothetical protein
MAQERREGGPAVENRWWVDTGKTKERARPLPPGERPPVGSKFFDIGYEFDQERARERLTDCNLKSARGRVSPTSTSSFSRKPIRRSVNGR